MSHIVYFKPETLPSVITTLIRLSAYLEGRNDAAGGDNEQLDMYAKSCSGIAQLIQNGGDAKPEIQAPEETSNESVEESEEASE